MEWGKEIAVNGVQPAAEPVINVKIHIVDTKGLTATRYAPVRSIEREDDGSFTAVVDDEPQPDTVTLPLMTEAEARQNWLAGGGKYTDNSVATKHVNALRKLGLIREETLIQRFERETGTVVTDDNRAAVEAALSWRH